MRNTIITLDTEDIFSVMTRSNDGLFSAIKVSVNVETSNGVEKICSDLERLLSETTHKISRDGDVIINIISPADSDLTLNDTTQILDIVQRYGSGNIMWGYETDDTSNRLEVNVIFEVEQPA